VAPVIVVAMLPGVSGMFLVVMVIVAVATIKIGFFLYLRESGM